MHAFYNLPKNLKPLKTQKNKRIGNLTFQSLQNARPAYSSLNYIICLDLAFENIVKKCINFFLPTLKYKSKDLRASCVLHAYHTPK